ncbi:MAG: DUF885 family protein, partial [Bacteroidia bacterium]
EVWLKLSEIDPEGFTIFGIPPDTQALRLPGSGDPFAFLRELNDPRPGAREIKGEVATRLLIELGKFDQNKYPQFRDLKDQLRSLAAPLPYPMHEVLAVQSGELYQTPFLMCYAHPVRNPSQAEAYIERLRALGSKAKIWTQRLDNEGDNIPHEVLRTASVFCNRFATLDPLDHPLYLSFARRMARKGEVRVPQDEAVKMLDRVASLLKDRVLPEWKLLAAKVAEIEGAKDLKPDVWDGFKNECELEFHGNRDSLTQRLTATADSLKSRLDALPDFDADHWLRATGDEKSWRDSLQLFVDQLQQKAAGLFESLPSFRSLEVEIQDSIQQSLNLPCWYLPADMAGHRKAKLFVHPGMAGNASGTARSWLLRGAIPGAHTRYEKRPGLALPLPAQAAGWSLYGAQLADEIGLNSFSDNNIPPFPEGKTAFMQLQLLACELALFDLGESTGITSALPAELVEAQVALVKSRPGYALAAWLEYSEILRERAEARAEAGSLFYLGAFNEGIAK